MELVLKLTPLQAWPRSHAWSKIITSPGFYSVHWWSASMLIKGAVLSSATCNKIPVIKGLAITIVLRAKRNTTAVSCYYVHFGFTTLCSITWHLVLSIFLCPTCCFKKLYHSQILQTQPVIPGPILHCWDAIFWLVQLTSWAHREHSTLFSHWVDHAWPLHSLL